MVLMSLHYDRFILDSWRFIQFERTFTYAYDAENFFTYPFFLFQVSILLSKKEGLHETLRNYTIYIIYAMIIFGYLLSYDMVYRLRLIMTIGMMVAGV